MKTVRHFWPGFTAQLNQLPDTRFAPFVRYDKRFLAWWGLLLFCFKLGSRRQLDYELRDPELQVLENANRLASAQQDSLPVHKTLNHFLGHVGPNAFARLRTWCVRRLIRMKTLDAFRLRGHFVVAIDGTSQHYRWVNDLSYLDSAGHSHQFDAILLHESSKGKTTRFAWITDFHVTATNVAAIAEKGGRVRSKIENQGFNTQKNSGLNLEHAYSIDPDNIKAFYYLLQIAHTFLQLLAMGSLLKHLARRYQTTPIQLFGSLKNMARRLLDCFRYFHIPADAFDPLHAARCQIRLDSS